MRTFYLIRHGRTAGNLERRYIGSTDEPLCPEGRQEISGLRAPEADRVFASPLKRCLETGAILYPRKEPVVIPELAECRFGEFEGHKFEELIRQNSYQQWFASCGMDAPPGGESREEFKKRVLEGFEKVRRQCEKENVTRAALVVHGGTIMALMEEYARPWGDFYDYQVRNGEGYELILADAAACDRRISSGPCAGGSGVAVSSGAAYGEADRETGTNYQKISARNEAL